MSLVDTLKKEHEALKNILSEVKAAGINSQEGRDKLIKSKALLLGHLKKEDEQLYPALKQLEETKEISRSFQDEMKEMSVTVLEFFNKYENGVDENMEFAKDFGRLIGALNSRITKEEVALYRAYQEHVA